VGPSAHYGPGVMEDEMSIKKRWLPSRVDIQTFDGQGTVMDVGADAVVTVTIKGPNVDLTFTDVQRLHVVTSGIEHDKGGG
jgi:hypothetical protein